MLVQHTPLEEVYIFFDTATYDEIERDVKVANRHKVSKLLMNEFPSKVTTEAQLGLIGGTMGLLTGFSILSGVEIIYYLLRCLFGFLSDDYPFLQVLHVPQGPQSCHRVCCQQKI